MKHKLNNSEATNRRDAFTLVEMLVATGLVVLMMLLFANIFSAAVGTMTEQRGMANNDSKARILDSTIRGDLEKMTFRQPLKGAVRGLAPLAPGDVPDPAQKGYFYYSENDPLDPTDDVLQFTIDVRMTQRSDSNTPLFGKASILGLPNGDNAYQVSTSANQPVLDDGNGTNGTTISRAAEVQYFIRNGNLYRRVYLLRDPRKAAIGLTSPTIGNDPQPTHIGGGAAIRFFAPTPPTSQAYSLDYDPNPVDVNGDGTNDAGDFYNDFDMSVTRFAGTLYFNSVNSLENGANQTDLPIALPYMRSGFSPYNPWEGLSSPPAPPGVRAGQPREFSTPTGTSAGSIFLGRFTQEETSDPQFLYPGFPVNPTNSSQGVMWVNPSPPYTLQDTDGDGVVDFLAGGPRTAEDLLMVGVESFDVKVWDPSYREFFSTTNGNVPFDANGDGTTQTSPGAFVDLGHNYGFRDPSNSTVIPAGIYSIWNNLNPTYGPFVTSPLGAGAILNGIPRTSPAVSAPNDSPYTSPALNWNRVYDTWHPDSSFWVADANTNGVQDAGEFNSKPPYRPLLVGATPANTTWGTTPAARQRAAGQVFFPPNSNGSIGYRVVRSGEAVLNPQGTTVSYADFDGDGNIDPAVSNATQPEWPLEVGALVTENGQNNNPSVPATFADDVVWQAFDNRIGLEMMQITVRYRDPTSGLSRQVTIQHSFVE